MDKRCPLTLYIGQHQTDWQGLLDWIVELGGVEALVVRCDATTLWRLSIYRQHVTRIIWVPVVNGIPPEELFLKTSPRDWVSARLAEIVVAGFKHDEIWLHLHNEVGAKPDAIAWEVKALNYGLPLGMKFAVGGCSVGTPNRDELPRYRELIKLACEKPDQVVISLHSYFSVFSTRKTQYYMGRYKDWLLYKKAANIPGRMYFVMTEYGLEDISDDHPLTQTLPKTNGAIGPVHAIEEAWKRVYNEPGLGNKDQREYPGLVEAYVKQLTIGIEQVFGIIPDGYDRPAVLAAAVFGAFLDDQWKLYDVWALGKPFRDAVVKWWKDKDVIAEPPVVEVVPDKPGTPVIRMLARERNIRKGPGVTYADIKLAEKGKITIYPDTRYASDPFLWYWTGEGWIADNAAESILLPVPSENGKPKPKPSEAETRLIETTLRCLEAQKKALAISAKHIQDRIIALDEEAQRHQASLLQIEDLIESHKGLLTKGVKA